MQTIKISLKLLIFLYILNVSSALITPITDCLLGCQYCLTPKTSSCIACQSQFQLSITKSCIIDTRIPRCSFYGQPNICTMCRPSFMLNGNLCQRMTDACLGVNSFGICNKCVDMAVLNINTSSCMISQLNCLVLGRNRKCIQCRNNYRLDSTKYICVSNSPSCLLSDPSTGLCLTCSPNFTLVGTTCFATSLVKSLSNCYLISSLSTCIYCKQGYSLTNGSCIPTIIIDLTLSSNNCTLIIQYYDIDHKSCKNVTPGCASFDYVLMVCVYCMGNKIVIGNLCRKDLHVNCLNFTANISNDYCNLCKPNYYLNQLFQCVIFPPFCQRFTNNKCVKCIQTFLLNTNLNCVDPNCLQINPTTGICIICNSNFAKDIQEICRYVDPNCQQSTNFTCISCKQGYQLNNARICIFLDKNCLNFSVSGVCINCSSGYYYNSIISRCMILPDNCLASSSSGQCVSCMPSYSLLTTYQCILLTPIPNCKYLNPSLPTHCSTCITNYYITFTGQCKLIPIFCQQYDGLNDKCLVCNDRGTMDNIAGQCWDRYCQFLEDDGNCLGCFDGYGWGTSGECVVLLKDKNCKNFQHAQCMQCSDRYYFDRLWNCIPVSTLCKSYNPNNGLCTQCYTGYVLSNNFQGDCIIGSTTDNSQVGCISIQNLTGNCLQCSNTYQLVKLSNLSIFCMKIDQNANDSQCVELTKNKCTKCKAGYSLNTVQVVATNISIINCILLNDTNCKTLNVITNSCQQCYTGYYYSHLSSTCVALNPLCASSNLTTGSCVTCFPGYTLSLSTCIVNFQTSCLQFAIGSNVLCEICVWGYLLQNGSCMGLDLNCQIFVDRTTTLQCAKCYSGYVLVGKANSTCLLDTDQVQNCLTYNTKGICIQCSASLAISVDSTGKVTCQ